MKLCWGGWGWGGVGGGGEGPTTRKAEGRGSQRQMQGDEHHRWRGGEGARGSLWSAEVSVEQQNHSIATRSH